MQIRCSIDSWIVNRWVLDLMTGGELITGNTVWIIVGLLENIHKSMNEFKHLNVFLCN